MRVLQVNKFYPPVIGGVETVVQNIADGLRSLVSMRVLVCAKKGKRTTEAHNGVTLIRASNWGTLLSMPLSLDFLAQYRKESKKADIIQLHAPFPLADLAVFLFPQKKSKIVVWWHSDIVRQKIALKLLTPLIKHTLTKADRIIVASEANIRSSDFLPAYKHKCRVIPFGLDFDQYPIPKVKDYFQRTNTLKLLFVGRLVYYKGIDVLLEAMRQVQGAELFIVGKGPAKLQAMADSRVHFMDELPRDQLLAAFYDCDIFVFPSVAKSEAFGLCQLEAMYYGKPVINTDLPTAVPTVSIHGETGLTVPCGDADALANAINTLVHDDALRRTYGANAARRVRAHYDQRQMMDALYNEYRGLMNK